MVQSLKRLGSKFITRLQPLKSLHRVIYCFTAILKAVRFPCRPLHGLCPLHQITYLHKGLLCLPYYISSSHQTSIAQPCLHGSLTHSECRIGMSGRSAIASLGRSCASGRIDFHETNTSVGTSHVPIWMMTSW